MNFKVAALALMILISAGFAVQGDVKIKTDKSTYKCGVNCERMTIEVEKVKGIVNPVDLSIDFENEAGTIYSITGWTAVKDNVNKNVKSWKKEALPLGSAKTQFVVEWGALGAGKFNISVYDTITREVYGVLDPWFNSTFTYRTNVNLTSAAVFTGQAPQPIVFNGYNSSRFKSMSYAVTFYNATSGTETRLYLWEFPSGVYALNNSGDSKAYIWANYTFANATAGAGQYYIYYGNTSAVNQTFFNPYKVFWNYDDFNASNTTMWANQSPSTATFSSGVLCLSESGSTVKGIRSIFQVPSSASLEFRINSTTTSTTSMNTYQGYDSYGNSYNGPVLYQYWTGQASPLTQVRNSSAQGGTPTTTAATYNLSGTFFDYDISRNATFAIFKKNLSAGNTVAFSNTSSHNVTMQVVSNGVLCIDHVFTHAYDSTMTFTFGAAETYDDTAPVVQNVAPATPYYVQRNAGGASTALLNFTYNASTNNSLFALSKCELWVNNGTLYLDATDLSPTNNTNRQLNNSNVTANLNSTWYVSCEDANGNEGNSSLSWFYVNTTTTGAPAFAASCPASAAAPADLSLYQTSRSGACCLNSSTLREYWTVGNSTYTKDGFCQHTCVNNTFVNAMCAQAPATQWLTFVVVIGVLLLAVACAFLFLL